MSDEVKKDLAGFNWFPGHMNKAIKEIEAIIKVVDVVLEVVDARAPFSTANPLLRNVLIQKPRIVIMSKCDLADDVNTKKWCEFFEKQNTFVYLINGKNQKNIKSEIVDLINKATKDKQDRDKNRGIENPLLNGLVVGIPNVGKSTFISQMARNKKIKTGNKPGLTRGHQRIIINENINLIDTPGILPSKFESETIAFNCAAAHSIRLDIIPKERFCLKMMKYIYNIYPNKIEELFSIQTILRRPIDMTDSIKIFEQIAKKRKYYILDDVPDIEKAMDLFLVYISQDKFLKVSFERPIEIQKINNLIINENDIDETTESQLTIEW